jgi:integrase/recombinase XerD
MTLAVAIRKYVAMKRLMGKPFAQGEAVLQRFCVYEGNVALDSVTKWQVTGFLERSSLSDVTWLLRYRLLKAFFEYWVARNELKDLPIPPARRPGAARRFVPCIYSVTELQQLLHQADMKRNPKPREFGPLTFRTVLTFLYGTGARINETLSLRTQNVDLNRRTVTFHRAMSNTTRTIPIGPSLCRSLQRYVDSLGLDAADRKNFFIRKDGRAIRAVSLTVSFQTLRRKAKVSRPADLSRQPRVQDLRRTFAVHCMRAWLKKGKDLRTMLPALGAYLGHVSLASTEAYLAVTPARFLGQMSRLLLDNRKLGQAGRRDAPG